jgi:TolA-binding protein
MARAEVPVNLEASYSEAVVSFNLHDYPKALSQLNELLLHSSTQVEFLELKALVLKGSKDDRGALKTYGDIIRAKLSAKEPRAALAPYYFEAGVIMFRQNRLKEARLNLEESVRSDFNPVASQFFLGNIAFKESRWSDAEKHFAAVVASRNSDLSPAAGFYLGRVALKRGDSSEAYDAFSVAKDSAQAIIDNPKESAEAKASATEIVAGATQAIAPFDRAAFFGGVTLLGGYDTNVLAVPSSQSGSSTEQTGKGSVMTAFQGGAGYMSSPVRAVQFVPSYRTSFNFNFNENTRLGDFFTHTLSLYMTRKPLAKTSYGAKVEGTLTFQNQLDSTTEQSQFKPYSVQGAAGPYVKFALPGAWQGWVTGADLAFIPHREYGDADTSAEYQRSGLEENLRVWLRRETGGTPYWNPSFAIVADHNGTSGSEFYASGVGFEFGDPLKLTQYPNRSLGERDDKVLTAGFAALYRWRPKVSLLANAQFYDSISNVPDSYQYTRLLLSAGASYNF